MKVIIAGSRNITSYAEVLKAIILSGFNITEVVSGRASGVDQLGEKWAKESNIPIKTFSPNWKELGRSAGILRNEDMGDYAEALIAIWDGQSRGTQHMIAFMSDRKKPVFIHKVA